MQKLILWLPAAMTYVSQKFGENANSSYAAGGLKGHTTYDWGIPYGAEVYNCADNAYCYSVMHQNDPTLMDYRGVFTLVEGWNGLSDLAEVSYGHFSTITAKAGETYRVGAVLGLCGNTGEVFTGNHEVTEAEKRAGSHAGAHLHGPQVRPVKRVTRTQADKQYLSDQNGLVRYQGYYYEVVDYGNGFNGCVDPSAFFNGYLASKHEIVENVAKQLPLLQRMLQALLDKLSKKQ